MAKSLATFLTEIKDELGSELTGLYPTIDALIERWLNRGQDLLGERRESSATITWAVGDLKVALPADFYSFGWFADPDGEELQEGHVFGSDYVFSDPSGARNAASGTLYYYAYRPVISSGQASVGPSECDTALIAYCQYRFFSRIANSRSDFSKFATLTGSNNVDITEVRDLAQQYLDEFLAYKDSVKLPESMTYYGD